MENRELLIIMEKCGHFLYHRRGGKWGQQRIVRIVADREEISQKELQDILNIKAGSLSELVTKIVSDGYIEKTRDENDKRRLMLKVTEKGKKYLEECAEQRKKQEELLFKDLSKEEQDELMELLKKLFASWEENFDEILFKHRHGGHRRGNDEK